MEPELKMNLDLEPVMSRYSIYVSDTQQRRVFSDRASYKAKRKAFYF